jgi:transposase-like protein
VDTITLIVRIAMRQRTSYPKPFKAQIVQECLEPGVSMASVALRHGINANLVRKWIPAYRDRQAPTLVLRKKLNDYWGTNDNEDN